MASSDVAQGELGDGVVPVVDGEAHSGESEEDAEDSGELTDVAVTYARHGNRSRPAA